MKGRQQLSWRFFWRFHAGADAFWAFWGGEIGSVFRRLFERSERLVDDVLLFLLQEEGRMARAVLGGLGRDCCSRQAFPAAVAE